MMDYAQTVEDFLKNASLFDLYRLQVAINHALESPQRNQAIRDRLRPGQEITYFDWKENRLIEAKVIELRRTRLLVENKHDGQRWTIPLYWVNVDGIDPGTQTLSEHLGLDRSQLRLGDRVGFKDRQNNDVYGEVIRLNRKTATISVEDGTQWRVPYSLLFPVVESGVRAGSGPLIEGRVANQE
jgi:hypothetical protein